MLGKFKTWFKEFWFGKEEPVKTPTVCNCNCNGNCACSCGCNGECQCKKAPQVVEHVKRVEMEPVEIIIPVRDSSPVSEVVKTALEKKARKPFSTKEAAKIKTSKKSAVKKPKKK